MNKELYNLLKAINKKFKYIGYDKSSKASGILIISSKKLIINKLGYFKDLWEYYYGVVLTDMFPCLCSLIDDKESKLYKIDDLLKEVLL